MTTPLPSWRPGPTRDAILTFLDDLDHVPVDDRVAYVDNDGTMWCEKPTYVQLDFFVDALQARVADDPSLGDRPEFAAVLSGDMAAVGEIGLAKVAGALAALFDGQTPEEFGAAVDGFLDRYRHRTLGVGLDGVIYQPMLELLAELRAREFTIGIVTGGGTEFVRQVSQAVLRRRARAWSSARSSGTRSPATTTASRSCAARSPRSAAPTRAAPRSSTSSRRSVGPRSSPSATRAATARCSSGRRPARTAASPCSSTTTTPSASSPTRAPR